MKRITQEELSDLIMDNKDSMYRLAFSIVRNDADAQDHGEIYYSPLDLELQLILSDEQLRRGLNEEYLGYYEYEDSFVSVQGYKVNVLKTTGHMSTESVKRVAIFVGDGIQYKMSGQVSKDTLIDVVHSMELSKTWK